MDQIEYEEILRQIAQGLDEIIKEYLGEKGFCLIVFDFLVPGISNYISNAKREDMIKALLETADRLEKHQDIGAVHPVIQ